MKHEMTRIMTEMEEHVKGVGSTMKEMKEYTGMNKKKAEKKQLRDAAMKMMSDRKR